MNFIKMAFPRRLLSLMTLLHRTTSPRPPRTISRRLRPPFPPPMVPWWTRLAREGGPVWKPLTMWVTMTVHRIPSTRNIMARGRRLLRYPRIEPRRSTPPPLRPWDPRAVPGPAMAYIMRMPALARSGNAWLHANPRVTSKNDENWKPPAMPFWVTCLLPTHRLKPKMSLYRSFEMWVNVLYCWSELKCWCFL